MDALGSNWAGFSCFGLFVIRSSSDGAFSDNLLSNETTTTPREDIDFVFNSEGGAVPDSSGAGSGDLGEDFGRHIIAAMKAERLRSVKILMSRCADGMIYHV